MKFKTTLKSQVFDFVKKTLAYNSVKSLQPQENDQNRSSTKILVELLALLIIFFFYQ